MYMVVIEMSVGNRISELRNKRNLTQDGLANRVGISRAALSHYEKDRREPDYDTLVKLADFFDVTTDFLLGHDKDVDKEEKRRDAIMNKIATEFPDIDLMFKDIADWTAEDFEELYDYIKFKMSQKEKEGD